MTAAWPAAPPPLGRPLLISVSVMPTWDGTFLPQSHTCFAQLQLAPDYAQPPAGAPRNAELERHIVTLGLNPARTSDRIQAALALAFLEKELSRH